MVNTNQVGNMVEVVNELCKRRANIVHLFLVFFVDEKIGVKITGIDFQQRIFFFLVFSDEGIVFFAEAAVYKSGIKIKVDDTLVFSNHPDLVVGEVSGNRAECVGAAV